MWGGAPTETFWCLGVMSGSKKNPKGWGVAASFRATAPAVKNGIPLASFALVVAGTSRALMVTRRVAHATSRWFFSMAPTSVEAVACNSSGVNLLVCGCHDWR